MFIHTIRRLVISTGRWYLPYAVSAESKVSQPKAANLNLSERGYFYSGDSRSASADYDISQGNSGEMRERTRIGI